MEKISLSNTVTTKLVKLIDILYDKEYFGFKESSKEYVSKIYEYIYTIESLKHYKCKKSKHGDFYIRYTANSKTQYFITFFKSGERYYIQNIFSNHTREYSVYIKGL